MLNLSSLYSNYIYTQQQKEQYAEFIKDGNFGYPSIKYGPFVNNVANYMNKQFEHDFEGKNVEASTNDISLIATLIQLISTNQPEKEIQIILQTPNQSDVLNLLNMYVEDKEITLHENPVNIENKADLYNLENLTNIFNSKKDNFEYIYIYNTPFCSDAKTQQSELKKLVELLEKNNSYIVALESQLLYNNNVAKQLLVQYSTKDKQQQQIITCLTVEYLANIQNVNQSHALIQNDKFGFDMTNFRKTNGHFYTNSWGQKSPEILLQDEVLLKSVSETVQKNNEILKKTFENCQQAQLVFSDLLSQHVLLDFNKASLEREQVLEQLKKQNYEITFLSDLYLQKGSSEVSKKQIVLNTSKLNEEIIKNLRALF